MTRKLPVRQYSRPKSGSGSTEGNSRKFCYHLVVLLAVRYPYSCSCKRVGIKYMRGHRAGLDDGVMLDTLCLCITRSP